MSILQGKEESLFVAMPSYRTKQVDENQKAVYQDVCYPVTKEFREKLYRELISSYQEAKDKVETVTQVQAQDKMAVNVGQPERETPFR